MYSHYWAYLPNHPRYAQAWPTIVADTGRIIDRVRQAGIVIAGPDGSRRPSLDISEGIAFNGDAGSDLDGEPFQLLAPLPLIRQGTRTATAFCKTSRVAPAGCDSSSMLHLGTSTMRPALRLYVLVEDHPKQHARTFRELSNGRHRHRLRPAVGLREPRLAPGGQRRR